MPAFHHFAGRVSATSEKRPAMAASITTAKSARIVQGTWASCLAHLVFCAATLTGDPALFLRRDFLHRRANLRRAATELRPHFFRLDRTTSRLHDGERGVGRDTAA